MRQRFLLFGLFIVCSTILHGQDNILIYSKHIPDSAEKAKEILQKNKTYTSVDFVGINLDRILESNDFSLQFEERDITLKKERIETRGVNNYVLVGSNDEGSRILISVLDNDIQGVIETDEEVFTIETVDEKQYALITVDHSMLREACDYLEEEYERSSFEDANIHHQDSAAVNNEGISFSPILRTTSVYDCKIRVLVLYTPNAMTSVSNIKNTILTAVALTNQSFINSQINYQIELVYAGQTNYSESGFSTDLSRLRNTGDGYMDEVHTLRNRYSADICVLLTYDLALCGMAKGIGVSADDAFCIVSTNSTCATTNYSFGHEIGHLLGCRHDHFVDNNATPFPYGHGYVNPSKTWRTIMAYQTECVTCPRLQYWSNPNVTHAGEPMGTTSINDNARVWNERSNTIMAFRQPDDNVTLTSSDMSSALYADVIAKQDIETGGTVNINDGSTLNTRAGNSIILQPGFSVQSGAEFSASIEEVDDCEECASAPTKIAVQHVPDEFDDLENHQIKGKGNFSYAVSPDSSTGYLNITYSLDTEMPLTIELVDIFGLNKKNILSRRNQPIGDYIIQLPVANYPSGTYFLILTSSSQKRTEKIIINK